MQNNDTDRIRTCFHYSVTMTFRPANARLKYSLDTQTFEHKHANMGGVCPSVSSWREHMKVLGWARKATQIRPRFALTDVIRET